MIARWQQDDYPISGENVLANRITPTGEVAPSWSVGGRVISNALEAQHSSKVCTDGAGGYFFVWTDGRNVPANHLNSGDIYAQRIRADGAITPGWPMNGIAVCQEIGWQWVWSGIVADGQGGFYVVWEDNRTFTANDVYVQRVGPGGSPAPGWPVNGLSACTAPLYQGFARIAPDGLGGVFVTWDDERGGIWLHRLLPDGTRAPGFPENGLLVHSRQASPEGLLPDGVGGVFIVVGEPVPPSRDYSVLRVQSDGMIAPGWLRNGQPVPVTLGIVGPHEGTTWTPDGLGGLYVRWDDARSDNGDQYVQHLQSNGDRVPGWPAEGAYVAGGPGIQWGGQIVADGAGGAYIVFNNETATNRVYAQHINYDGTRAAGWPVNGQALAAPPDGDVHHQQYVQVASDSMGGAIAAWEDNALAGRSGYAMKIVTDGVVATSVALSSVHATSERVRLEWTSSGDLGSIFTLERRASTDAAWTTLATLLAEGTGRLTYDDPSVEPDTRYAYRLAYSDERGARVTPEAWVDVPARAAFALHGAVPNPAHAGDLRVRLSLAAAEPARLTLHDLAGRAVTRLDLAGDEPGERLVRMPADSDLAPGLYWLVLEQRAERATARVTLLR